jgi:ACS family hexuronate transporter-like MFS transporter
MTIERNFRIRWSIAGLLCVVTVINYVDRQALSVAFPVISDEYHLTNSDYSHVVFAFLLAYAVMQAASGKLVDWLGTKAGLGLFVLWWSLADILHAAVGGIWGLSICRFLLGAGEAGNWPSAVKAVSEWFPARERAVAVALFNSGASIGAVLAPPLISWIVIHSGWRAAFVVTGLLGFAWLAAWGFVPREARRTVTPTDHDNICGASVPEAIDTSEKIRWRDLFRFKEVWALVLGRLFCDPVWWFYVFWLPTYLNRQRNFSMEMIGMFAWIPYMAAGVGGFVGGGVSSRLLARGWTLRSGRMWVLGLSGLLMISGVPAVFTSSAKSSMALISLAVFAYASWAAILITLASDLFPRELVGSVYGIAGSAASAAGMLFALVTGYVIDRWSYVPIYIATGILPIIGTSFVILLMGKVEPISLQRRIGLGAANHRAKA